MGDKYAVRTIRLCEKDCLCLYVCSTGASDTENSVIDKDKCIGCGACEHVCPARPMPAIFVKGFDRQRLVWPMSK